MKLKNISKKYGNNIIFSNLNLEIKEEKITVILGKSGVGKTTLLEIIAGFIKDYDGEINFESKNHKISYIFQNDVLIPWKTVYQNIEYVLKKENYEYIMKYLKFVGLDKFAKYYPKDLSGGMKRRVGIARAFAYSSQYLIMDEPFQFLDIKTKSEILRDFKKLQEIERRTVIFVSHDIDTALKIGDYIVIMDRELEMFQNKKDTETRAKIEDFFR